MSIPILNIYYLLCYAWDKLEESQKVSLATSDYENYSELFTRVLLNGCAYLFKKGLDRDYVDVTQEYRGIKGKIDFGESLKRNSFQKGRAICVFDEFQNDILANQILKATLYRLGRVKDLDKSLTHEIWDYYFRLGEVSDLSLTSTHFTQVKIHRNNSFYDFLIHVCKLVYEHTVLNDDDGNYQFKEFTGSDKEMARLFEAFVFNFYRKEQSQYRVRREDIVWQAIPIGDSNVDYLPKMRTDITLEGAYSKIIMDAKFYSKTAASYYDSEKFHSSNLYQLHAYLKNVELSDQHPGNATCQGILLYPQVDKAYDEMYEIGGHVIRIATVDLSKEWKDIHERLLGLVRKQ